MNRFICVDGLLNPLLRFYWLQMLFARLTHATSNQSRSQQLAHKLIMMSKLWS